MQHEPNPPIIGQKYLDASGLLRLLVTDGNQRPRSLDEVERAAGKSAEDSLRLLHTGGLIHRSHGFVWASQAAVLAHELHQQQN